MMMKNMEEALCMFYAQQGMREIRMLKENPWRWTVLDEELINIR